MYIEFKMARKKTHCGYFIMESTYTFKIISFQGLGPVFGPKFITKYGFKRALPGVIG